MAGFSVSSQAVVDEVSANMLTSPVSGLLGLGWQSLASSDLASGNAWSSALFAVQFTRYTNDSSAQQLEPGGVLNMGTRRSTLYTNSSLYTGSIDYIDVPGTPSYWYIPLTVTGPASSIQAIYAQIPNSQPATGEWAGYYSFPCSTTVNVELSFGGRHVVDKPSRFCLHTTSSTECIGAFFEASTGAGAPSWIIGDAFLKNVYSVFRLQSSFCWFRQSLSVAIAENGAGGAVPSATIGVVSAAVTNTSNAPRGHALSASFFSAVLLL
ncbi:aspartic peptidase domain-containing protein [Suillus cothurnatus]|nr:aspartic peptidase domain-containing protein [Suillus cothurnatus]